MSNAMNSSQPPSNWAVFSPRFLQIICNQISRTKRRKEEASVPTEFVHSHAIGTKYQKPSQSMSLGQTNMQTRTRPAKAATSQLCRICAQFKYLNSRKIVKHAMPLAQQLPDLVSQWGKSSVWEMYLWDRSTLASMSCRFAWQLENCSTFLRSMPVFISGGLWENSHIIMAGKVPGKVPRKRFNHRVVEITSRWFAFFAIKFSSADLQKFPLKVEPFMCLLTSFTNFSQI